MPTTVFISYSHDSPAHRQRVLALADKLRADGLDARLDQYVAHPAEGWPRWSEQQILAADFVLLVCTPTYRRRFEGTEAEGVGRGANWEGLVLVRMFYDNDLRNDTLLPVLFDDGADHDIPGVLRAFTHYRLPKGYEALYRRLTAQPETPAPPIGTVRTLPPAPRPSLGSVGSRTAPPSARSVPTHGSLSPVSPSAASSTSSVPSAPSVPSALAELDERQLLDELARVLWDPPSATLVAMAAGLPPQRLPAFETSLAFWTRVMHEARSGAIAGGVHALARAAATHYPANPIFGRGQ
ncbi:MAG: SEFIR domain-containing protein [Myxococcota bacterium]